jgi:hypothetical protein
MESTSLDYLPNIDQLVPIYLLCMSATNVAVSCISGVVIFLALTEQSPIPGL